MNFAFSSEQEEFQYQIRKFVTSTWSVQQIARDSQKWSRITSETWNTMSGDLCLLGLSVPESGGGAGFSYVEAGIACYEFGRSLVGGEFFSTTAITVPTLLSLAGDSAADALLSKILKNHLKATVAIPFSGQGDSSTQGIAAQDIGGKEYLLSGKVSQVINPETADVILVYARLQESLCLFQLTTDEGVVVTPLDCVDETRPTSDIALERVSARMIGRVGDGTKALIESINVAKCLFAMEQIGAAEACMEMTVEHAKLREQFGGPIGKFQVIKHKCAEMLLALEPARAAAYYGTLAASDRPEELQEVANMVKIEAANALYNIASHAVQIHGGLGITWEHPVSWYFRRSVWAREFLGAESACNKLIGEAIGL